MSTLLKKIAIVALIASVAPTIAMARVKPLHEYKGVLKQKKNEVTCESKGYLSASVGCATCSEVTISGGTTCYSCSHNNTLYPFTQGGYPEWIVCDDSCTIPGGTTQYSCRCDTAGGYYSKDSFISTTSLVYKGGVFEMSPVTGDNLICYDSNSSYWSCTSGTTKKSASDLGYTGSLSGSFTFASTKNGSLKPYISYYGASNSTNSNIATICVKLRGFEVPLYAETASKETCLTYSRGYDALTRTNYFYYTGCETGGNCVSSTGTCGAATTHSVTGWTGSATKTIDCKEATGCNVGKVATNAFCYGSTSASAKVYNSSGVTTVSYSGGKIGGKFAATTESVGNYTCVKITGCAEGYVESTLNSTNLNLPKILESNASDDTTSYDAAIAYDYNTCTMTSNCTDTTDRLICRMPTACKNDAGYYDTTCDTGCWDGFLSWFMPQ